MYWNTKDNSDGKSKQLAALNAVYLEKLRPYNNLVSQMWTITQKLNSQTPPDAATKSKLEEDLHLLQKQLEEFDMTELTKLKHQREELYSEITGEPPSDSPYNFNL